MQQSNRQNRSKFNLHELANSSSRIPRASNKSNRVSKFSDAKSEQIEVPHFKEQLDTQYQQDCQQGGYCYNSRDSYQYNNSGRRNFNNFSNRRIQEENNENKYLNHQFQERNEPQDDGDIKNATIQKIKNRLRHNSYRINQSVYQNICDQLENEKIQNLQETVQNPNFNQEEYMQKDLKEIGLVMDEEDLGNYQNEFNIVFIRHAFSKINYFYEKHKEMLRDRFIKQHFRFRLFQDSNQFIDSELHDYGIKQCELKQNKTNKIQFSTVFVSPMARALQTCVELFKNHPQKESITFYVHQNLGEMLKKDSDIFDQQKFIVQVDEAKTLGLNFNTTKYFNLRWQENIIKEQYNLRDIDLDPLFIKELLFQIFPQPLEDFYYFKQRSLSALRDIQNHDNNQNNNPIAIISHSLVQNNMFQQLKINVPHEIGNLQLYYHKY